MQDAHALSDEILQGAETHYSEALLVRLFGLPLKDVMLTGTRADLRILMEQLEDEGRVAILWRSLSGDELRDYLIRKLTAPEIAKLVGLDVPLEVKRPPRRAAGETKPIADPVVALPSATSPRILVPVDTTAPRSAHLETAPNTKARIEKLEDLRRYLVEDLQRDLEALDDLGSNEQRFQHRIVNVLESRISHEPFHLEEKQHLADLDQFPDVMIRHARGDTAIEIKPNGGLRDLIEDANKLKGYLRARKIRVTFGVLIYRSPYDIPDELRRSMRGDSLHLVCVRPAKRR